MIKLKNNCTAIILCGGFATRLGKICLERPKSMLYFGEYPFLQYLVSFFIKHKLQVIISTFHKSEYISEYFGEPFWQNRGVTVVKEKKPLGTGGAIRFASHFAKTEQIYICNGDTVLDIDLESAFDKHLCHGNDITAIVTRKENVPNRGAIKVESGLLT